MIPIESEILYGKLSNSAREQLINVLKGFEGKTVEITVKAKRDTRSNKQNRYMYGVIYKLAAKGLEDSQGGIWSVERTKRELKIAVGHYEEYVGLDGEIVKEPLPTPDMNTLAFTILIDHMRLLCLEFMGINIPNPDGTPFNITY